MFLPALLLATTLNVQNPPELQPLATHVNEVAQAATEEFSKTFGALSAPINISIGGSPCLRVGYDFESKSVKFCDIKGVKNFGTESDDVIRHEMFHAMLCQIKPERCLPETLKDFNQVALHEALADFFAYSQSPDSCFGENYSTTTPCLRTYVTPLCYSLVDGPHAKGNALVANLIQNKKSLGDIATLLKQPNFTAEAFASGDNEQQACFSATDAPDINLVALNYPASDNMHRFKIEVAKPLSLRFDLNPSATKRYPHLEIKWEREHPELPAKFEIRSEGGLQFSVKSLGIKGFEKITALYVADGAVIGSTPTYFSAVLPSP